MRNVFVVILAVTVLLTGCASIPLSTMMQLSSLEPQSLAQVDPAGVRVKVSLPIDFELDTDATRLNLMLQDDTGEERFADMTLSLLQRVQEQRSAGFFSPDVDVYTYLLSLSPEGAEQLRDAQQFVLASELKALSFSVTAPLASKPADVDEMTFWADLRLAPQDEYMHLIDAATVKFEGPLNGR